MPTIVDEHAPLYSPAISYAFPSHRPLTPPSSLRLSIFSFPSGKYETIRTDKFPRRLFGLFVEINRIKITNNDNIREKYKFAVINHGIERLTFRPIERRTL